MARDVEANVKVNDKTAPGLTSVERRFKQSGDRITKEYDRFGKRAGDGLLRGIGAVSPQLAKRVAASLGDGAKLGGPLLLAGVSGTLPALSGLIGAAVTGGAAGLGILGGVALASRDARVKASGDQLVQNLLGGLQSRSGSFIQPVLQSIDLIERKFLESGDTIQSIFENSSRFVVPLTDAITDALQDVAEGADTAIGRSAPVMRSLNDGVRDLGLTAKGFFDDVSRDGEASARNLDSAFSTINGTLKLTGETVGAVNTAFGWLDQNVMRLSLWDQIKDARRELDGYGQSVGEWVEPAEDAFQRAGDAAEAAETDMRLYERALADNERAAWELIAAQTALFDDTTRVAAAADRATEAARENGKTLDENTQKGRNNRDALSSLAGALNGYRDNLARGGATTAEVNKTLGVQRSQLIQSARQFGATKGQAAAYADQLLGIPKDVKTDSRFNKAKAEKEARDYKGVTDSIPRNITTTISVRVTGLTKAREAANLRREMLMLSAGDSFGLAVPGSASRTGGPTPVSVTQNLSVSLDGAPFAAMTATAIDSNNRRQRFAQKVGKR
jgi:hypothetical protein